MVSKENLLTTNQMASFVARGFLRFDEFVPAEINQAVMAEIDAGIPSAAAGVPLSQCYPEPSAIGHMLRMPKVEGIIQSLVGPDPLFDHQAVHVRQPNEDSAQGMHGDSIIDTRTQNFDVQLMYFPHDVPLEMGGTLVVPGSQYRRINEMDIARYQNLLGQVQMVCKAGTLLALHHGIWHCGRQNKTNLKRYMFKVRLNPRVSQVKLWNTDDLTDAIKVNKPIFTRDTNKVEDVQTILGRPEPWFEDAAGRLEIVNRIKMWRYLTDDPTFDVHYWLTRLENTPANRELVA